MVSMNSFGLSTKLILISAGVISLAVGLRFSAPIAASGVPAAWSFFLSWLKPPYLYLIINGIIITIAASSHFHDSQSEPPALSIPVETHPPEIRTSAEVAVSRIEDAIVELRPVTVNGLKFDIESEVETVAEEEEARDVDDFVDRKFNRTNTSPSPEEMISPEVETVAEEEEAREVDEFVDRKFNRTNTPPSPEKMFSPEVQSESQIPVREKPPVASRFGHLKANRTTAEGARSLRVSRAKKHETLESTWKMITEGRHVPLTRHLKKTDTWEQGHVVAPAVPNSDTLCAPTRIRKEASPGQDELNRRVEAFIKKFNEEMRIQRQESMMNRYAEQLMIKH